uniref:Uncharacterized protein n=1 Tax=Palpitomonas bilix TaxID=652834 RepID=A0A7S3GHR3_9EUKA
MLPILVTAPKLSKFRFKASIRPTSSHPFSCLSLFSSSSQHKGSTDDKRGGGGGDGVTCKPQFPPSSTPFLLFSFSLASWGCVSTPESPSGPEGLGHSLVRSSLQHSKPTNTSFFFMDQCKVLSFGGFSSFADSVGLTASCLIQLVRVNSRKKTPRRRSSFPRSTSR